MKGTINIGNKEVEMLANGASPFLYKRIFRKDFFTAVGDTSQIDIDAFTEMGFVMHMQAVKEFKDILDNVTVNDFYAWVADFEALDLPMAVREIMALYYDQSKQTVTQKKK